MCSFTRAEWRELPELVRAAVHDECGDVIEIHPVPGVDGVDFAAILVLPRGHRVFCKGVRVDSSAAGMFRYEALVASVLPDCAPGLLWQVEQVGWLVFGYEYIGGRHADLSPESGDILVVIDALVEIARQLTPSPLNGAPVFAEMVGRVAPWRTLRHNPPRGLDAWTAGNLAIFAAQEPAALEMMSGRTLAHTDVHEHNLLINRGAHITSWGSCKVAAPWVDMGHLVIRLIAAGHAPDQAEDWVGRTTLWRDAPSIAITALAIETYGLWEHLRHADPRPNRETPTRAARTWAMYRTDTLPSLPSLRTCG